MSLALKAQINQDKQLDRQSHVGGTVQREQRIR